MLVFPNIPGNPGSLAAIILAATDIGGGVDINNDFLFVLDVSAGVVKKIAPVTLGGASFQPLDATLTAFAALTIAANSLTIGTGADAFSQTTFAANTFPARASTGDLVAKTITDAALTVLDDTTVGAMLDTLGGATHTGTGGVVCATSPTLVTPVLGVATATTVNKVTITAPATGSTLTIADGATLTVSASATITNGTHSGTNTGDQTSVSGNAGTVTVADAGGDTTTWVLLATSQTGNQAPATDAGITYNASTNTLGVVDLNASGNVVIDGNLTVSGTTVTMDTATVTVEDPLIKLAKNNNAADAVDIGVFGLYDTSGSQDLYAGLFRDASDGKWKLFKDLQAEPTTTVDTGGTGYAVATLVANLEGNVTGNVTGNLTGNVTGNVSGSSGSCTGNAATATALATPRAIYGNNFDGTAALTQIIASTYGGTGNGFTKFSGPGTSEKTFTLPDATCTILTTNAAVTVAQGGTGVASTTAYAVICGGTTSTGALQSVASVGTAGQVLTSNGAGALPTFQDAAAGGSVATDSIWDAKGDLAAGTGANTAARLPIGTNGFILTADSGEATGMKWAANTGGGASTALDNLASVAINAALVLGTSDAFALGSATKMWSDLFLASGAVINFNNGDLTVTHSSNSLAIAGGTSYTFDAKVMPASDDGAPLGDTSHNFSDLFLASGAVVNFANSNVVLTHSSGILTLSTGTLKIANPTNNSTSVVTTDGTQTLTNKRITKRASSTTSASSLTPDIDSYDYYEYTALAANLTINAPTGTPTNPNLLAIVIKDNGSTRTLTFNSAFQSTNVELPTATTAGKTLFLLFMYNSTTAKWHLLSKNEVP